MRALFRFYFFALFLFVVLFRVVSICWARSEIIENTLGKTFAVSTKKQNSSHYLFCTEFQEIDTANITSQIIEMTNEHIRIPRADHSVEIFLGQCT